MNSHLISFDRYAELATEKVVTTERLPRFRVVHRRGVWFAQRRKRWLWRTIGPLGMIVGWTERAKAEECCDIYMRDVLRSLARKEAQ